MCIICVWFQGLKSKVTKLLFTKIGEDLHLQPVRSVCILQMANTNAVSGVPKIKYVFTSFIALSTIGTIVIYIGQPPSLLHIANQQCTWTKPKMKRSRNPEVPPWLSLLADYKATTRARKNLYVWPAIGTAYRLGNILFNYAATFGIAWRNRRIPIWPEDAAPNEYDITKFFNLRIPVDRNNTITRVSKMLHYCLFSVCRFNIVR